MGYYTEYNLEWSCVKDRVDVPIQAFLAKYKVDFFGVVGFDGNVNEVEVSVKWYSWKESMKKLSAHFPAVLFTLTGEGEDSGDIWKAYFLGGKCQHERAVLTIADFDESKLE